MSPKDASSRVNADDEADGPSPTLDFDRICIDFLSLRNAYQKPFIEFVDKHRELLDLPGDDSVLETYLERVWPDGLPGTGIIANTRPFDHYLLRPPVYGPLAASFAAGSVAPAFSLQERGRGFCVVGFSVTPHLPPRWFECEITGLFVRWRSNEARPTTRYWSGFAVASDPGMDEADLLSLRELPEHRKATKERLQGWGQYLDWKEGLVRRDQISLRYEKWRFLDGRLQFLVRGEGPKRLQGKELMAVATAESASPDKWTPKGNRGPRGRELGEVSKVESRQGKAEETPSTVVFIEPDEELLALMENTEDPQEHTKLLPADGFLLSAIFGDLAPLLNQRRGLDRLRDGRSFAPRLADYLFDVSMALVPTGEQSAVELPPAERLNARLNQDQLAAVQGALAAPDFFLIQGPPGTGKTTVIAEICYQVARGGGRVLVASQTNLAVDNALARLGNRPNMRPLRLGDAKRVGDEFKEFLQENVVERWFRGISAECERRWSERESVQDQLRGVNEAISTLRRVVNDFRECADKLRPLYQRRKETQREVATEHANSAAKAELAKTEEALSDVLVSSAQWLTEDGARPSSGSLEHTKWARTLPKKMARHPGRPIFPDHLRTDEESTNALLRALDLLDSMKRSLAAVDALAAAATRTQAASHGLQGTATAETERQLQELLAEQRRLAASEDEEEVRRLPQVNRQIKRLRGQVWSDACRALGDSLSQMWGAAPPAALEDIARSLEPHPAHAEVLERLLSWIEAVRTWGEALKGVARELAEEAIAEAEQLWALAEEARSAAEVARDRAKQLEAHLGELDFEIADIEAEAAALRVPWSAAWPRCSELLTQGQSDVPWPPAAAIVDRQVELLADWKSARAAEGDRHQRWRSIQRDWLQRIRQPSEADRVHLTDLYVAHSNVVGLTCNEAGKWQFYDKAGFRPFDVIIVDEVSKATPPELLLPMLLGTKAILVGDHRQLPPMFREKESSYKEAIESGELSKDDFKRFERMVTSSLFEELFEQAPDVLKASLWTQYRMHPQVMRAVNYFYAGHLQAGPDAETLDRLRAHRLTLLDRNRGLLLEPTQHILWIDTSLDEHGRPFYEAQVGSSKVNELEARTIGRLLYLLDEALRQHGYAAKPRYPAEATQMEQGSTTRDWLQRLLPTAQGPTVTDILSRDTVWLNGRVTTGGDKVRSDDQLHYEPRMPVGLISFYGKQLGRLRSMREELHRHLARSEKQSVIDLRLDTVDRFQGMERPIVIVSLVRAVKHLQGGDFVRDFRRINVALSRAQGLLIIVGAQQTFAQALVELPASVPSGGIRREAVYRQIFEHAARCGGRRDARSIPPAPWEKNRP